MRTLPICSRRRISLGAILMGAYLLLLGCVAASAGEHEQRSTDGEWKSLISDDWHMWQKHDRRIQWGGNAALRSGQPKLLQAEPGNSVFLVDRKGKISPLRTRQKFGDCQLHLEFMIADGSNSGVKFHGHYELQIYDSFGKKGKLHGSDCGGIYPRWHYKEGKFTYLDAGIPPRINAAKRPGTWQSLDVEFRAPRFAPNGEKEENARFSLVKLNDQVIHRDVELKTPTGLVGHAEEAATGPLLLQLDHGPVAFRNIRIRPIAASDEDHDTAAGPPATGNL